MAQPTLTSLITRHTYLFRAFVLTFGMVILVLTITYPFFTSAQGMTSKITVKEKESKELADKVSILSGIDETILDERVKTLDKALPAKKDVVLYLSAIDGLSRELSLNFGGISLTPGEVSEASPSGTKKTAQKKEENGLHTLETDIEITGTQENIYSFLRFIEESTPLMQIKDVTVSEQKEGTYALGLRLGMLYAVTDIKNVKGSITLFDDKEEKYFQELSNFRSFAPLSDVYIQDTGLGKSDLFQETILQQ